MARHLSRISLMLFWTLVGSERKTEFSPCAGDAAMARVATVASKSFFIVFLLPRKHMYPTPVDPARTARSRVRHVPKCRERSPRVRQVAFHGPLVRVDHGEPVPALPDDI